MPYSVTPWINNATPAMNATNLNKLKNELVSQAAAMGVAHTLPTWTNGIAPAVSDSTPLNEMERVLQAVATSLGLNYTPTSWSSGWVPPRNSTNLNKMEQQANANRAAIEALPPPPGNNAYFVSDWDTVNNGQMHYPPWATIFQVGTPSTIDLGLFGGPAVTCAPNGRVCVIANPYGAGKVLRCQIQNSDPATGTNNFQKSELGSYEPVTWADGSWTSPEEIWILMEMYLPNEFGLASGGPNGYTNLMDLHPSSSSGVPGLGLGGYSTTNIQLYAGVPGTIQRKNYIDITNPANRNRKLTLVIGANIATSGGWVEAWLDGVNTIPRFNATTAEASETGPYFKQGLYKEVASSFPNGGCIVYYGRTLLGQTKADVS